LSLVNNKELTAHVHKLSLERFGVPFKHTAQWNNRLRSTGGRFFPKDMHLDFNPKMADIPEFDRIILHELTHYHLYAQKRGYKHRDRDFKKMLAQVGGLRYAPTMGKAKHTYICQKCQQTYQRQRKIDTQKYACGKCRGRLVEYQKKEQG
jgi:SprT-like protein